MCACRGIFLIILFQLFSQLAQAGQIQTIEYGEFPVDRAVWTKRLPAKESSEKVVNINGVEFNAFFVAYDYFHGSQSGTIMVGANFASRKPVIHIIGLKREGVDYKEVSSENIIREARLTEDNLISISAKYYVDGDSVDGVLVLLSKRDGWHELVIDFYPDHNASDAQYGDISELIPGGGVESWSNAYYSLVVENVIYSQQVLALNYVQDLGGEAVERNKVIEMASTFASTVWLLSAFDWSNKDVLSNWRTALGSTAETFSVMAASNELEKIYVASDTPEYISEPLNAMVDIVFPVGGILLGKKDGYVDLTIKLVEECSKAYSAWVTVARINDLLLWVNSLHVAKRILKHRFFEGMSEREIYEHYNLSYKSDDFADLAVEVAKVYSIVDAGEYTPWDWVIDVDWDNIYPEVVEGVYDIFVARSHNWMLGRATAGNIFATVRPKPVINIQLD